MKVYKKEEVLTLPEKEFDQLITNIIEITNIIQKNVSVIVEKILAPVIQNYAIDTIEIDPNYEYHDEGFYGNHMVYINGTDPCEKEEEENVPKINKKAKTITYTDLQEKIDNMLETVSSLINNTINIDCSKVRAILQNHDLDTKLSAKKKIGGIKV